MNVRNPLCSHALSSNHTAPDGAWMAFRGLVFYKHAAPNGAVPKPNSTGNGAELYLAGSSWVPIAPSSRKPTETANRCNLRHGTPKALQKALYVGFSQIGLPLQVVWFGGSQFPIPEARLAG